MWGVSELALAILNFHQCLVEFVGAALTRSEGVWGELSKDRVPLAMAGVAAQGVQGQGMKINSSCQGVSHPKVGHWLGGWRSLSKDPTVNGEIWVLAPPNDLALVMVFRVLLGVGCGSVGFIGN